MKKFFDIAGAVAIAVTLFFGLPVAYKSSQVLAEFKSQHGPLFIPNPGKDCK